MSQFDAKDDLVRGRAQKVQRLSIPLLITHNATPASKSVASDEPSILFVNVEGIVGISTSSGALESGEVAPTLATATDSTGVINICVLIKEPLVKVMDVQCITRNSTACNVGGNILAFSTVSANSGQSIFANLTTGVNLAATDLNACIIVEYITSF